MRIYWAWCVVRATPTKCQSRCPAAVRIVSLVLSSASGTAALHHGTYIFTGRSRIPLTIHSIGTAKQALTATQSSDFACR
jgi:hypothetical protein